VVEAAVGQIVAFAEDVEIHHRHRLVVEAFHHVVAAVAVACWVVVEILFHLLLGVVALDSRSLLIDLSV